MTVILSNAIEPEQVHHTDSMHYKRNLQRSDREDEEATAGLPPDQVIQHYRKRYESRLNCFITFREMMLAALGHPASRDAGVCERVLKQGSTWDELIHRLEVYADLAVHAREKLEEIEDRYADFDGEIVLDDKRRKAGHEREVLIRIMLLLPEYVLERPAPESPELPIADE